MSASGEIDPRLASILTYPGNHECQECLAPDPEWSSVNLGILLCIRCAGCHRSLGTHISTVKSLTLDAWNDTQIQTLGSIGNKSAREAWEPRIPLGFNRPTSEDPDFYRQQWIRTKYLDKSFCRAEDLRDEELSAAAAAEISDSEEAFEESDEEDNTSSSGPGSTSSVNSPKVSDSEVKEAPKPTENNKASSGVTKHSQIVYSGYLLKQSPHKRNWKNRWFVLTPQRLYYYKTPNSTFPIRSLHLLETSVLLPKHPEQLLEGGQNQKKIYTFQLLTPSRNFLLNAEKDSEMFKWVCSIRAAILRLKSQDQLDGDGKPSCQEYSGVLEKEGGKFKSWRKRFVHLDSTGAIHYYKDKETKTSGGKEQGSLSLKNVFEFNQLPSRGSRSRILVLKTDSRTWFFHALDEDSFQGWTKAFENAISSLNGNSQSSTDLLDTTPIDLNKSVQTVENQSILFQGYLAKQGQKVKNWKRRYFVLMSRGQNLDYLSLHTASADSQPDGHDASSSAKSDGTATSDEDESLVSETTTSESAFVTEKSESSSTTSTENNSSSSSTEPVNKSRRRFLFSWKKPLAVISARSAGRTKNWREENILLVYYRSRGDAKPDGVIAIPKDSTVSVATENLVIPESQPQHALQLCVPGRTFYFSAEEEAEIEDWIAAIQKAVESIPATSTPTTTATPETTTDD